MLKILYASDLHGSTLMFKKLTNAALIYGAHKVVIGGDIIGKGIVPVVRREGGYEASIYGTKYKAKNDAELQDLFNKISSFGFYPHVVEKEEELKALEAEDFLDELIKKYSEQRLQEWAEFARKKVEGKNINFYMIPGNDDPYYVDNLIEKTGFFLNHNEKVMSLGQDSEEYSLVGYAKTNMTPWKCPRDVEEEVIRQELNSLMEKVPSYDRLLLNTHCPPYGTTLDLAPLLDKNLKPVVSGGGIAVTHVGCKSVREVIEKYQPLLGLHGHIHESRSIERIGRTVVVNAGSAYNESVLYAAIIVLNKGKLENVSLIKG
ncbi:MAG: metallophosphoesterase [Infirmifilum sp.]